MRLSSFSWEDLKACMLLYSVKLPLFYPLVKIGRCVVIFFPKRLHSFPGFVPAQLLVIQGDAGLSMPGYAAVLSPSVTGTGGSLPA